MPVQQKTKAAPESKAPQAAPQAPEGFNVEGIGDMPEFMEAPASVAEESGVTQSAGQSSDYAPSAKTIEALSKIPKAELKAELGIDIDDLVKRTKRYGILENLAYNSFTTQPIYIIPKRADHQKFGRNGMWASVRISVWKGEDGSTKWNYEIHPVRVSKMYVRDENTGEYKRNSKGDYITRNVIDDNPIKPDEVLSIDGVTLTPDQMNQVRLTGQLQEPFTRIGINHKPVTELVDCNPLNRHEFVRKDASVVAARLSRFPVFKFKNEEFKLTPRQIDAIVARKGVWLESQKGEKPLFVQYNCAYDKLTPAINFDRAMKAELDQAKSQSKGEGEEMAQTQSKGVSHGRR